jgi:ATPase subunit of ABC transporter with duplicated ATPase domains
MSGGEFQLLHAWACLMGPARLVLLDEPTNNLDQGAIELLLAELEQLTASAAC